MRGRMSFVGAVARGLVVFTAMTASLALALFIAITGPPSNDEMAGLRAATDQGLQKLQEGAGALGEAVCAQLPPKLKAAAECEEATLEQAKVEPPPATPLPPDTTVPLPPVQIAREEVSPLLGANPAAPATSVPVVMAPVHVRASAPPHARGHTSRTTRATTRRPARRTSAAQTHRTTAHPHTPPPRRAPTHAHAPSAAATPVVTHRAPAPEPPPAHATAVVAPAEAPPPHSEPAVAIPHPQLAAPEPRVAAAPPSAAPSEDATSEAPAADPPPEKQDPDQAQTF